MQKLLLILSISTIFIFADGQATYKNCTSCHGERGELSALQKSLLIGGVDANLTLKKLNAYKNGELNQYGLGGIMQSQLSTLSFEDLEELAQYISTLENNNSSKK